MSLHSTITGAENHEPKGVESASSDTVYVSNGSGSGVWKKLTVDSLDTGTLPYVSNTLIRTGTGTPEGNVSATVGTLYLRSDGGTNTTLYVKETGTGTTGWVAK